MEEGVQSAKLCHLANISYRLKRRIVTATDSDAIFAHAHRAPYVVPERV